MKILYVSNIMRRMNEGNLVLFDTLLSQGHEVHVAANFNEYIRNHNNDQWIIKHIDFIRNPLDLRNITAIKQLYRLMKEENYDLVHCNTPVGGLLGRIAARLTGTKPVIYMAHGFHFYKGAPLLHHLIYKSAEKMLAKWTDGLVTINHEDFAAAKQFKLRENSGKVFYVPGVGVDTRKYASVEIIKEDMKKSLGIPENALLVIMIGDLIKRKNYESGIKAMAQAANKQMHCIVCGKGPLEEPLKNLAQELGIADRVHFLGFRTDMPQLLKASDIFLFPTFQEGLPRALMEAMSAGLPVIVSNIRGNTDLVEPSEGGFLVSPTDIGKMASSLDALCESAELREKMSRINLEKVKDFDIQVIKDKMLHIYLKEMQSHYDSFSVQERLL